MALPGIQQFDPTDRVAIVTGGSKGLGQVMAAGVASAGAEAVLVSRHGEEVQEVAEAIEREYGRRALGCETDITIPEQVEAMVAAVHGEFGRLDILLNSAGINTRGPIEELTLEQFEEASKFIIDRVAMKRWGELQEIQGSAIDLGSEAASYTTGSMLAVDGGWTAQ